MPVASHLFLEQFLPHLPTRTMNTPADDRAEQRRGKVCGRQQQSWLNPADQPPGDIWQCLQAFFTVTRGGGVAVLQGTGRHPTTQQKSSGPKPSVVLALRNPCCNPLICIQRPPTPSLLPPHWLFKQLKALPFGACALPGCLPGSSVVRNPPAKCRRRWFGPWVGKTHCRRSGNPLQYSCLESSTGRGAWWANSLWGCKKAWHDLLETSASPAAAKTFLSWVSIDKINPQVQWLFSPLSLSFVESKNGDLILLWKTFSHLMPLRTLLFIHCFLWLFLPLLTP